MVEMNDSLIDITGVESSSKWAVHAVRRDERRAQNSFKGKKCYAPCYQLQQVLVEK